MGAGSGANDNSAGASAAEAAAFFELLARGARGVAEVLRRRVVFLGASVSALEESSFFGGM